MQYYSNVHITSELKLKISNEFELQIARIEMVANRFVLVFIVIVCKQMLFVLSIVQSIVFSLICSLLLIRLHTVSRSQYSIASTKKT